MLRPVYLRFFAVLAIFTLLVGCSSDSGTTTTVKQGDPNNPAFQSISAEANSVLDSLVERSFNPLTNPWQFPIDTMTNWVDRFPMVPGDTIDYTYDGGWYSIYLGSFATSNNKVVVDSIMFTLDGNPYAQYDIHATGIEYAGHITRSYDGTSSNYDEEDVYIRASYSGTEYTSDAVTVDGTAAWEVDEYVTSGSIETHNNYAFSITVEDLQFDKESNGSLDDSTPSDGSITLTVVQTAEVTESGSTATTTTSWSFTVSVSDNGAASVEVNSDNTVWNYSTTLGN